ncbi:FAD-binding domain-containing protein [Venturia nashicola]|nr:FAD-binding domain-containing protein [Venturia nashicola]
MSTFFYHASCNILFRGVSVNCFVWFGAGNFLQMLRSQWFSSEFHATDPISLDSPGWSGNISGVPSCPPILENGTSITGDPNAGVRGCQQGHYSQYVVNATSIADIVTAVRFAKWRNLRLVVKNTGHDFLGRSTGYGALSIWTHHLKNITYHESFNVGHCPSSSAQTAATLGAGVQVGEMYEALEKYGMTMVGGANPTVGVMGWFQGGGHGPLSSTYGMGAHNLLQATVVLPSGEVVVTDDCRYPDLFYALRGGGGGSFGVVVSATMKAFPSPRTTHHTFVLSTKGTQYQKEFYNTAAWILSQFPALKDAGLQGYFGFRKIVTPTGPTLNLNWGFYLFEKSAGSMEALFQPIRNALTTEGNSTLNYFSRVASAPTFYQQYLISSSPQPVATMTGAMGGWLMPRSALTDVSRLARTLEIVGPTMDGPIGMHISGHFSCPNNSPNIPIALNPTWNNCVVNLVPFEPVPDGSSPEIREANARKMTFTKNQALKDIAPYSGAYFNECDVNDPTWRQTTFGPNYEKLLSIKRLYDPNGLLYCKNCVGSEQWQEQIDGGLCQSKGWGMAEMGDGDDDEFVKGRE